MALAVPAIWENIMATLVNIVDTAMVGFLGPSATAAAALNASPMWFVMAISMAVSGGVTVLIARAWGAEDYETAGNYARQSLTMCILLGLVMTVVVELIAPYYPLWMKAEADVISDATAYMQIIGYSYAPRFIGMTLFGVVRGCGDTKTPMRVSIGVNLLNVVGNFFLIYPARTLEILGGVPMWGAGLGVRGAAISTAISTGLTGVIMVYFLARRTDAMRFDLKKSYTLEKKSVGNILHIGLPIAGERASISGGQILYTSIISSLGTISLSAHYLATTAEGVCYNPAHGFEAAVIIMVGQALGAKDEKSAERYGKINIILAAAVMVGISLLMYLFAPWLIRVFTANEAVVSQGASALRIIAFAEPLFATAIVASGALRGAGDTIAPWLIGMICMLGIRLPSAYLFVNVLNLGLNGAWYAMALDLCGRGIFAFLRFHSGGWKLRSRKLAEREQMSIPAISE